MNSKSIDLSVIVPVYNASLLIERCLDSIYNQETKYSFEIVLVDDGSTDNTISVIDTYKNSLPNKGFCKDSIVLYQQKNSGPAMARNKGVELAQGKYCAYLDGDDFWNCGFIEKTLNFLNCHDECVAVSVSQKHCIYGGKEVIKPQCFQDDKSPYVLDDFYSFWARYNHVCTGSVVMRRNTMLEVGGQRVDMRVCEDLEFWLNIAAKGRWGYIPEILFVSDGGLITIRQGWKKYAMRFNNVPYFLTWFNRLKNTLTSLQIDAIKPRLNGIVCGISRAMISGGDFKRAYDNLASIYRDADFSYLVRVHDCGLLVWYVYCFVWRTYQYFKINKGYFLSKIRV